MLEDSEALFKHLAAASKHSLRASQRSQGFEALFKHSKASFDVELEARLRALLRRSGGVVLAL